ncbi:MAG: universal stress protein [Candidatus Acidiferrum sp.]
MRILLAIDGSKFSEAATRTVIAQGRPGDTEVRVMQVIDVLSNQLPEMMAYYPGVEHARDAQRKPAEALVAKTAHLLRAKGLQVTAAVELGSPKSKIIDIAAEWHADLIVLGSHGRTGLDRFLLGSLPDSVLRHAHCSVELVRLPRPAKGSKRISAAAKGKVRRILLAVDDSKFSEAAARLLIEQIRSPETEVRVLHVVEPLPRLLARGTRGYNPALDKLKEARARQAEDLVAKFAEMLLSNNLKVTTAVGKGDPKSKILDAAEQWKAELIVLGSIGQTGLERFLMGSVSDTVACHARCSVEVVRIRPSH